MDQTTEITTLLLDIGGVLLTNSWDRNCRRRAAEHFNLDLDELNERHHLTFSAYEEGKIDLDCYLDRIVFYDQREFPRREFKQFMFDLSKAYPEMMSLMKDIKRHHNLLVAAISNDARELLTHRVQSFDLKLLIDFFVCSCFVHCRKPDEDIFRIALDVAQVRPESAVYIDDRRMYADVARGLGIHAIHHRGIESTMLLLLTWASAHLLQVERNDR